MDTITFFFKKNIVCFYFPSLLFDLKGIHAFYFFNFSLWVQRWIMHATTLTSETTKMAIAPSSSIIVPTVAVQRVIQHQRHLINIFLNSSKIDCNTIVAITTTLPSCNIKTIHLWTRLWRFTTTTTSSSNHPTSTTIPLMQLPALFNYVTAQDIPLYF